MSAVPRPLIAVLAVTVLAFVLWTVALKHTLTGSGGGSGSNSPGAYQTAINKARALQGVVNSAAGRAGGTPTPSAQPGHAPSAPSAPGASSSASAPRASGPAASPTASSPTSHKPVHLPQSKGHQPGGTSTIASAAATSHAVASVPPAPKAAPSGIGRVGQALRQHKVLALLFYNPASPDDRAVQTEMSVIPTEGGKVVKLAIPIQQLGSYAGLLNDVPVNFSPTLVLINRDRHADEIAGFADSFEIAQRVAQALQSSPAKQ